MSEPTWELLGGGGVVGGPIDYIGTWAAGTQYQPGQIVSYNGVDYLACNPSLGQTPPLAFGIGAGYGTSLPASPVAGQEYTLVDSLTNPTYQWRFRYNAGSSSAYKWEFVGGPAIYAAVEASEFVANGGYVDLGTVGPQVVVPRSGEYTARIWCGVDQGSANNWTRLEIILMDNGAYTNPVVVNGFAHVYPTLIAYANAFDEARIVTVAGHTLKMMYAGALTGGGVNNLKAFRRRMSLIPVRVA